VSQGAVFWFDWPQGVFVFDGSSLDNKVFDGLRTLIVDGTVNSAALSQVWLSFCANRLWLSLPLDLATTPTDTFVYDPSISGWTRYRCSDGKGLAFLIDFVNSSGGRRYLAFHPTQPFPLQVGTAAPTDDIAGAAAGFESYYTTRWQDGGIISAKKMWRQPDFVVKQPSNEVQLTISIYRDWEEASPARIHQLTIDGSGLGLNWGGNWGSNWGAGTAGSQHERGQRLGLARSVQLKIAGPTDKAWGVNSITYKYNQRRVR